MGLNTQRMDSESEPAASPDALSGDLSDSAVGVLTTGEASRSSRLRIPRASSLEKLETEYSRVVGLVESVQTHLIRQGERTESMTGALSQLAESLAHLPEASKTQLGLLSSISDQLHAANNHARQMEQSLSQLPHIADAQREAMVSIGRQMDVARQSSERVATTLEAFRNALGQLGTATSESVKVLQDMRTDASAREERLASIFRVQTQRLTLFAWSALVLAGVAALTGIVALLR